MTALTRDEVIDRLARIMRDRFAPDFHDAPPPDWAMAAAADIIDYHQPMLRDTLLADAFARGMRAGRAESLSLTEAVSPSREAGLDADVLRQAAGIVLDVTTRTRLLPFIPRLAAAYARLAASPEKEPA